jgi:beta-lactamase superfamily II metal-dependent hydrolase
MTDNLSLEIDFLPVGEESKCGDAIAIRFGLYEDNEWKYQKIFIIDGGNLDSGAALVKHVNNAYNSKKADIVILTHPDGDHASGLRTVVEKLEIGEIWMHRPWKYWSDLKDSIVDGRVTKKSFNENLKNAYQYAYEIEQLAIKKKIEIYHPHQGTNYHIGSEKILTILGPDKDLYLRMIKESEKTPEMTIKESTLKGFAKSEITFVYEDETFETEHLSESDEETTPENNMSLILLLTVARFKVLFTGDAGTQGLYYAIKFASANNINFTDLNVFQVPHHGSKHNLSKGILKYIKADNGIISCSKKGEPKHPSKIVTNSLNRRNIRPFSTKGGLLYYHIGDVPARISGLAERIPFFNRVEDYK